MMLVAGLGNPGEKYKHNRHNAGFIILDEIARKWDLKWEFNNKLDAELISYSGKGLALDVHKKPFAKRSVSLDSMQAGNNGRIILIKPQTFMNDSGEAVSKVLNYCGIQSSDLLVVHDDVDLEPLQFRLSRNSSSAGHHGVQDIIDKIGTQDFARLRVGIGRPAMTGVWGEGSSRDVEEYVLQDFPIDQLDVVKKTGIEHLLSSLKL